MLTFNHQFDATATAEAIKSGKITPLEAVEAAIMKVEETNKFYNAVVHLYKEEALEEAKNFSDFSKPFAGVPILLKDAGQDYKGHPSTAGAELLKDNIAQVNSNFVQKVLDAGFIVIGHTNVPEFALKYISDSSFYGPVNNPVNTDYNAGGSSGGAAAALQSGMVPIATASDGGGSVRIPASFSGLVGFKPSRGKIATGPGSYRAWGGAAIDFALTKTVRDAFNFLQVTQTDQIDAMSFQSPPLTEKEVKEAKDQIHNLKFAYTTDNFINQPPSPEAVKAVEETADLLKKAGFSVEKAHPQIDGESLLDGYFAMNATEQVKTFKGLEAALGRKLERGEVEDATYLLYEYGKLIPGYEYSATFDEWDQAAQVMQEFHQDYDILIQPATAKTAPKIDAYTIKHDLLKDLDFSKLTKEEMGDLIIEVMFPGTEHSPYAYIYNLTGQPAISLPLHTTDDGLPLGVMFTSRKHREDLLFTIAYYMEEKGHFDYYDEGS